MSFSGEFKHLLHLDKDIPGAKVYGHQPLLEAEHQGVDPGFGKQSLRVNSIGSQTQTILPITDILYGLIWQPTTV